MSNMTSAEAFKTAKDLCEAAKKIRKDADDYADKYKPIGTEKEEEWLAMHSEADNMEVEANLAFEKAVQLARIEIFG